MADQNAINPVLPDEKKLEKQVPYSEKEKEYAGYLQTRLQIARDQRNQNHDEFDGMTYMQWYESNLKGANSFIAPKKNKEDTTFVTGTTRQALLAMIAKISQLNLSPEIKAFDKNDHEDEKKLLRQYELFSQGTAFAEEVWTEEFRSNKTLNQKKWEGQIKDVDWKENLEK